MSQSNRKEFKSYLLMYEYETFICNYYNSSCFIEVAIEFPDKGTKSLSFPIYGL